MNNYDDVLRDMFENVCDLELLEDEDLPSGMTYLDKLEPGDKFYIGDEIYIMLENTGIGECRVIKADFLPQKREFGSDANWVDSSIRSYLNEEYFEQISDVIGRDNIIPMQRDLTSLDGLDDFGRCTDKISMLTVAEYSKYHKILGVGSTYSDWWWTITSFSTPNNGYRRRVCCVRSYGTLFWDDCGRCFGVRPFLSIDSSLLVSLVLQK